MINDTSLFPRGASEEVHEMERSLIQGKDEEFLTIEEDDNENFTSLALASNLSQTTAQSDVLLKQASLQSQHSQDSDSWKVIIVDDDPSVHQATKLALKNLTFEGHPIEFISAFSAKEGIDVITKLQDKVASILLDVVMETNHAGLDLVEFIRESLQNRRVRIILRTGQPGEAPPESVIVNYDINDYQFKLDMTRQRLIMTVISALRSYRDLVTIDSQNKLLNTTLEKLRQSEQELKKYSHNLELLVSERTTELQKANEKLRRLATLDGLTKIPNRQFFDHYLHKYWQEMNHRQTPISLLLIDVDYFKPYNDCYGHLAGDECLKQVAVALSASLARSSDIAARYGGEEFGIILPQTNYEGAIRIAQGIFRQIDDLQLPHSCSPAHDYLTISMGISCLIPQEGMKQVSLIEMADIALYRAKKQGRNRYLPYNNIDFEAS